MGFKPRTLESKSWPLSSTARLCASVSGSSCFLNTCLTQDKKSGRKVALMAGMSLARVEVVGITVCLIPKGCS